MTVTLSDDTYGALLLKVSEFYNTLKGDYSIECSHIMSDRFSKRAYYFAVVKKGPNVS
jgi:hypothetical protein